LKLNSIDVCLSIEVDIFVVISESNDVQWRYGDAGELANQMILEMTLDCNSFIQVSLLEKKLMNWFYVWLYVCL
jgi:hypothetical protein